MITKLKNPRDFVESQSWYQTINFDKGLVSNGCKWCGDPAWENINSMLPESLSGCRILDLGCNAGVFCVRSALKGAKEVIGIDYPGWKPDSDYIEQREFVKSYFEKKHNTILPISYITGRMEEYLSRKDTGYFDYVFAIASIYYTDNPEEAVHNISLITDKVILRLRDTNIINKFTALMKLSGFKEEVILQERWAEKLKTPADDFYMFLYQKKSCRYILNKGHKEITGNNHPLNIWQLLNIVGTEIPIEKYKPRVPEEYLSYIPLGRLNVGMEPFDYNQLEIGDYPWNSLVQSIKLRGFLVPVIVLETADGFRNVYTVMEGKHRTTALAARDIYDPDFKVPCVVVKII
jgi:SAM-dependent methyltransferase